MSIFNKKDDIVRLSKTIGWMVNGNVLLLTHDDYVSATEGLFSGNTANDLINKMENRMFAREGVVFFGHDKDRKRKLICDHIRQLNKAKKINFEHNFRGETARAYLCDFLLAYHSSRKLISYEIEPLSDRPDSIIKIEFRDKQTFAQKIIGQLGKTMSKVSFSLSSVRRLCGLSVDFYLDVNGMPYYFGVNNAHPYLSEREIQEMNKRFGSS